MDYSKYIEMKMQAANTYKSNWQARDASEVTMRNHQKAQKPNSSVHQGPATECCTGSTQPTAKRPSSPTNGFSTDYSQSIVTQKAAGCAQCQDPNFGASGGVQLLSCAEVSTILAIPANPVKTTSCYCADPGIKQKPGILDCNSGLLPAYTGVYNHVPTGGNGVNRQTQLPQYPS